MAIIRFLLNQTSVAEVAPPIPVQTQPDFECLGPLSEILHNGQFATLEDS